MQQSKRLLHRKRLHGKRISFSLKSPWTRSIQIVIPFCFSFHTVPTVSLDVELPPLCEGRKLLLEVIGLFKRGSIIVYSSPDHKVGSGIVQNSQRLSVVKNRC